MHLLSAAEQRSRVREFLATQHGQWEEAEVQLLQQIERLQEERAALKAELDAERRAAARQVRPQQEASARGRDPLLGQTSQRTASETADLEEQLQTARYCEKELAAEVESLRLACDQLKSTNADLQRQLTQAEASPSRPAMGQSSAGGVLNWEAEKRRILAALESEIEPAAEKPTVERLKIEDVIRRTDAILAEKDREIQELKSVLANQSSNLGTVAVGAAALGELIDQDAVIREERQSLKRLQEEWMEKLRQAEIDISLERANMARQKAELEEKRRLLEMRTLAALPDAAAPGEKSGRGRWLARLGLKEKEEEA